MSGVKCYNSYFVHSNTTLSLNLSYSNIVASLLRRSSASAPQLQTAVGYTIHSLLLVPYFCWQRSHAVHHQFTNHMELGETHVPEIGIKGEGSMKARDSFVEMFGVENGLNAWGGLQVRMKPSKDEACSKERSDELGTRDITRSSH